MAKIYISAQIPQNGVSLLRKAEMPVASFEGVGIISQEELIGNLRETEVLICSLSTIVNETVIAHAPNLKLSANFGAGYNNIDIVAAEKRGITVTNTPTVSTNATAELTVGLILTLLRRIVEGNTLMHKSGFSGWSPLFFLGHELAGKTVGILGLGQIGQEVVKKLTPFHVRFLYTQRHQLSQEEEQRLNVRYVSKEALFRESDILSLHAPLTDETTHYLNKEMLSFMKETAFIINTSRGPLIDEEALCEALQKRKISGAALDVYEYEPSVVSGLKLLPNVLLTPHIGNATIEAREAMAIIVAEKAIAQIQGKPVLYCVNIP